MVGYRQTQRNSMANKMTCFGKWYASTHVAEIVKEMKVLSRKISSYQK